MSETKPGSASLGTHEHTNRAVPPSVVERRSPRSWEEVVEDIPAALAEERVDRLADMDLSSWLDASGHSLPFRVHVTEFCRASCAAKALCVRPELAYVTPCRLVVQGNRDESRVGVLLPSAAVSLVLHPDDDALPALGPVVAAMDELSERLVERLARGPGKET